MSRIIGNDTARFWSKVDKTSSPDGCWLWTAAKRPSGYGVFWLRSANRMVTAHRYAYEISVGPIPDGLHIDHVHARGCRSTSCVNPAHLEPVTFDENMRRWSATITSCKNGHPYTPENTYVRKDRPGNRMCKACRRERQAAAA